MNYLLFVLIFCSQSLFAASETRLVFLTWRNDPTTTMTVKWLTSDKKAIDTIHFTKRGDEMGWHEAFAAHEKVPQDNPYILHSVELRNLIPNTTYQFRLGQSKLLYSFRTMPNDLQRPIRFVTGGDVYSHSASNYHAMNKIAAQKNPRFAILGGDIAYAAPFRSKTLSEDFPRWLTFFRHWMQDMRDKEDRLIPILSTIGNHEVAGEFNSTSKEAPFYYAFFGSTSYSLTMGKYLHLIFLDSDHTQSVVKQAEWLSKTLKNSPPVLHRFATYHVGAYPSYRSYNGRISKRIREHWVPLFEKYKVHSCFESHDHAYKRTHALLKGVPHSDGIVYFGDGSWGVHPRTPKKRNYLASALAAQQVLVVTLTEHNRSFQAINKNGKIIDSLEQTVSK